MEHDFWHERWEQNQIGFHQGDVNPHLIAHSDALPSPGSRLLVPLCGNTLDMIWLAQRGYQVVGVELSKLAAEAFAEEQGLDATVEQHGAFVCYRMRNIDVLCGDIMSLTAQQLGPVQGYYDRAAVVALPEPMRAGYVTKLHALLAPGARGLLVTFDYQQSQMKGPPFSVPHNAVQELYTPGFEVRQLAAYDILDQEPRFRAAGLTALQERVYALQRR